jgi:uncharacterized protein YndB with AHSA1/START domain
MIRKSVLLACPPARAWALFTEEMGAWWPPDRRHTADPRSQLFITAAGRFWERGADGREVELGRVLVWEAGRRLVLDFYVGTDAQHPTEVEVRFQAEPGGTRVFIDHQPKPVSEEPWQRRAPQFERSWELVLAALAGAAAR